MASKLLSKSKYLNGMQCLKYLWLICNDPSRVPAPDASKQQIFDQGHLVGNLARRLFPDGIHIPEENFKLNLDLTRQNLSARKPLFEAGIMVNNLFSRLDILKPADAQAWDIIEVKSATSAKDENYHDLSFQKLCSEKAGIVINRCYLAFINNQYVKKGEIDPSQLFTIQDITGEVEAATEGIEDRISAMQEVISSRRSPEKPVGVHCHSPYDCPVTYCWEQIPEHNIFNLYRGGKKCFDLYYKGILKIKDIPQDTQLSRPQEIQKWCDVTDVPHVEAGPIREFLNKLQFPLYYLDFETINPAVPLFDGVRPYQRVPFQFSLHVVGARGGVQHHSFLAEGVDDPRPQFLQNLKEMLGDSGSIVTYNQVFEEGVLKELATALSDYNSWVEGIRERLVDLLRPFQQFYYYHPQQKGSASIKSVLPALTGKGYEGMAIADGEAASRTYLDIICGNIPAEEKTRMRADLEKYCGLDTEGMIWIMDKLRQIARNKDH